MPTIPQRKLGDVSVPAIGFGVMGISIGYGGIDTDEQRFKVLDAAYAAGCTNVYGDSEDLIGKWIKRNPEKRGKKFLATKFGLTMSGARGDPDYVKEQCELSLKRLSVDYRPLLLASVRVDPNTPIEKTVGAMAELVREGKVKYLGLSDCTAAGLRRAHTVHPIAALQIEFSPIMLEVEKPPLQLIDAARSLGTKIIAYSPLGRGYLTGQIKSVEDLDLDDFRRTVPKFNAANSPKILDLAAKIGEIGQAHNATSGQTTLAWILAQGEDFFVIPGTKKIKYLHENVEAGSLKLTTHEIAEVRRVAEAAEIPGDRYGARWLDMTYVESPPL
ncbi:NADP-dependent oxidoreductase domain-containing protein [Mycena metata]|uniref:NADP-dependent oxidoreductase domain-containing protein n=1 Tax=Mycena metata TaxID=1033252 RepID=A0AAD7IXK0_9AGAR|nr:NADP-dependent oxidoreductase domain-containing protein [Mycena metata]